MLLAEKWSHHAGERQSLRISSLFSRTAIEVSPSRHRLDIHRFVSQ